MKLVNLFGGKKVANSDVEPVEIDNVQDVINEIDAPEEPADADEKNDYLGNRDAYRRYLQLHPQEF